MRCCCLDACCWGAITQKGLGFRVHVANNWVLGFRVIGIIVTVLGKYMIIRYLDPWG